MTLATRVLPLRCAGSKKHQDVDQVQLYELLQKMLNSLNHTATESIRRSVAFFSMP